MKQTYGAAVKKFYPGMYRECKNGHDGYQYLSGLLQDWRRFAQGIFTGSYRHTARNVAGLLMVKLSRTILDPRKPWPFGQRKAKRVTRRQQQREALKTHGRAPF